MNLSATQPHERKPEGGSDAPPSTPVTGRFAYASGSRPLAGYTIKRGIGHGGFGEVYYATSDAGKEVALKLIRRNWDVELRGVTQCLNLKHPNLLSLYDVKQDADGDNWVVMELMSGQSLEEVITQHPNGLPLAETLAWIHGIAAGVAYLHDHGIVHRDLKPGNIFVDEGIVKIGDYGLSKFMSCSRRSGQTGSVGTVHYMAPEIANGRYGKEIDIYALGIILYEMLTGHVPFEGESVGEILMKHLTAEPDVTVLSEPYRTIVSRALAKDPQRRFESVHELMGMLPPVPAGAALTAAARFAGPNVSLPLPLGEGRGEGVRPAPGKSAGYSVAPEIAAAQQTPAGAQTGNYWNATPTDGTGKSPHTQDPIVRWFHDAWNDGSAWWAKKNFKPWQKVLILICTLFVFFSVAETSGVVVESGSKGITFGKFLLIAGVCYWLYRRHEAKNAARDNLRTPSVGPKRNTFTPLTQPSNASEAARPLPLLESPTRRRWQAISTVQLYQPGPPRERMTQLFGSMLLSTLICLVVSLVVIILRGETPEPAQYAWLATSAVLGSWTILIPAKFWEGRSGDVAIRRFVMLVMGLCLGALSYGLFSWLLVSLPHRQTYEMPITRDALRHFFSADGSPQMIAFLAYFGFLFVIPRWWKQADPLRSTRLSIWHTLVVVFWSWVLTLFWGFPQPWGLMLTATVAIAVQLASPWLSVTERVKLPRPTPEG